MSAIKINDLRRQVGKRWNAMVTSERVRTWAKQIAAGLFLLLIVSAVSCYGMMFVRLSNAGLSFSNELRIPPEILGVQGDDGRRKYELIVEEGQVEFMPGARTSTAGVNGDYLGPTLRLRRGDDVDLVVQNHLQEDTTMHWHGMHVPARMDGTPHQSIEPGDRWTASFQVDQQAATLWYHPHPHGKTGRQAYQGIAGMLLIDDEQSESLELPASYGIDDIPLILQDRRFDDRGQFQFTLRQGAAYGNQILINGTWNPHLSVESRLIRFRLLNGSNARIYYVGFDDNRKFDQIATDGGFLETPLRTDRVVLAPGERAEILVDFSDGKEVVLKSFPEAGLLQVAEGFFEGVGSGHFELLKVIPEPATRATHRTPTRLNSIVRLREDDAAVSRPMALGGRMVAGRGFDQPLQRQPRGQEPQRGGRGARGGFAPPINGKTMDMHRIDEVVRVGDTEIWELTNRTGQPHPFHVHLVQFQVLDRNGRPPAAAERGWKDTILVHPNDRLRIIMRFTRYADPQVPYMYHCHIMEHEDRGMMGQFLVVEEPVSLDVTRNRPTVVLFIAGFECEHCCEQVRLFDASLTQLGIQLLVVTPEAEAVGELAESVSATVVSDPHKKWAGWLGLMHEGPAHGTYLLNRRGDIVWGDDSDTPYMDVDSMVKRISELDP